MRVWPSLTARRRTTENPALALSCVTCSAGDRIMLSVCAHAFISDTDDGRSGGSRSHWRGAAGSAMRCCSVARPAMPRIVPKSAPRVPRMPYGTIAVVASEDAVEPSMALSAGGDLAQSSLWKPRTCDHTCTIRFHTSTNPPTNAQRPPRPSCDVWGSRVVCGNSIGLRGSASVGPVCARVNSARRTGRGLALGLAGLAGDMATRQTGGVWWSRSVRRGGEETVQLKHRWFLGGSDPPAYQDTP